MSQNTLYFTSGLIPSFLFPLFFFLTETVPFSSGKQKPEVDMNPLNHNSYELKHYLKIQSQIR